MRKKLLSLLLALALCLGLLPAASAAESDLPDWYFLFAIFKNVDADGKDRNGKTAHAKYSMTQDEVATYRSNAKEFEEYMNSMGVMRAHVDVVEIEIPVTELHDGDDIGAYLDAEEAAPLLKGKVNLDQYDHMTYIIALDDFATGYAGVAPSPSENGTGISCINSVNWNYCQEHFVAGSTPWVMQAYVHEFLHFMERMDKKWGAEFGLHDIINNSYAPTDDNKKACYTDIILNRAKGNDGTGVLPIVWQYPPHVLRTMPELVIPSGGTKIGSFAFDGDSILTRVTIPASVTSIGGAAFQSCTNLTSISIPASLASVKHYAFANCPKLADVYYGGTEAQWKAIQIDKYNSALTNANIHYNSLMADVKTTDWFAQPVAWALEERIAAGTSGTTFSPNQTCTQGQILTFLWRAKGEPQPAGAVSGSQYYAAAVQWAREQGVTSGTLSPDAPCSRADVVTYLWKLAGTPSAKAASFTDVPAGADCAGAVSWAVEQNITAGVSKTEFAPDTTCTRAQIAAFLYRALAQ